MNIRSRIVIAFAAIAAAEAVALAQPITYVTQTRRLEVFADGEDTGYEEDDASAPGFGPFNVTLTTIADSVTSVASQNSVLGMSSISATGYVQATVGDVSEEAGAYGESSFDVRFQLMAPQLVSLTGSIFQSGEGDPTRFSLIGVNTGTIINTGPVTNGTLPLNFNGILAPDTYRIQTGASYEFYDAPGAHSGYSFVLSIVPEPATITLVAPCTALLLRRRRR